MSIINEKDGVFRTHKFDKWRNLPFQYAQFLQSRSNRSVSQSYNIIQSQAFPILYLSNNVHDVMNELELLLWVLTANEFRRHRLKYLLMKFLRHGSFPVLKFDIREVINNLARSVLTLLVLYIFFMVLSFWPISNLFSSLLFSFPFSSCLVYFPPRKEWQK